MLTRFKAKTGVGPQSIRETKTNDYPFRVVLGKQQTANILSDLVMEQTWDNFKDETRRFQMGKDQAYLDFQHETWFQGRRFLQGESRLSPDLQPGLMTDEEIEKIFGKEK